MEVQTYKVDVTQDVLDDLKRRLERTRWPDEITNSGWDYGSNLAYVKELCEYWSTRFDWRAQERAINSYSHFRTNVDGLNIHFIHERGKGPNPMPLIVSHGWPGSFIEMMKIIPLLTDPASHGGDPADSFDVVVPSLPGYGFSDRPSKRGMGTSAMADLWAKLMTKNLAYPSFGAQGGDWGTSISARLGFNHPDVVKGIHITSLYIGSPYLGPGSKELSAAEEQYVEEVKAWEQAEAGYSHIQETKPQTLSYGLNDSPVGLAAWIVEKWRSWTDCNGDIESVYTKDEILTNITIYWVTQSVGSSTRIYYEEREGAWQFKQGERIEVPCGIAVFPKELDHPVKDLADRMMNVKHWTEMPQGGHFAAMEEPALLVEDIRDFFRPLRG